MLKRFWERYQEWYINYSGFSNRREQEGLPYFRDKLFVSILLLTSVLGVISYIPSGILAVLNDELIVLYADTIALLVLLFIAFSRRMSMELRKNLFSVNIFILSVMLLIQLGLVGNGVTLLFMLNIIITLYNGSKAGFKAIFINAVFYILLLFGVYYEVALFSAFFQYQFGVLTVILINCILFNLLIVFAVAFLINHLHRALLKENNLQLALVEKHAAVLKEKERAELSDKLKTAFLANMSHEIRTPMYGILGCAEFLRAYNTDDNEYLDYVNVIEENGKSLLDVVSDIIEISKIDAGITTPVVTSFDINETINEIYNSLRPKAIEKGITFLNDNNLVVKNAIIKSDKGKLTAILKHLLKNAIKYTEKGGRVSLKCISYDNDFLEFYVEDTGIGIPKNYFKIIFDPFYQVDIQNRRALHGSGIGLAIAKSYAEILGGELSLESREGIGSTFWFAIKTNLTLD
ncbi:sensor histidine kinase [Mariniflexile sp.]|uniref:sensor histidine kinase n=1 Tax=Mariniflexile sp. TaxID=1979402 RepID=UPI0035615941